MTYTNISEAQASLDSLIETVQKTQEPIIIGDKGTPVAILSPFKPETLPRKLGGSWEGKVEFKDDFDDEMTECFYNSSIFPTKK